MMTMNGPAALPQSMQGTASHATSSHELGLSEPQPQVEDVFDEAAFERAFESAKSDMQDSKAQEAQENLEIGQDILINESAERLLQSDHLVEQERIGADTILHEAEANSHDDQHGDNPDELARTAGQLLDSVKNDHSRKFQESNFLSLMRRLRDKEVRVEGDKMVDVSSPWPSTASQHHHYPPPEMITCRVFQCELDDG